MNINNATLKIISTDEIIFASILEIEFIFTFSQSFKNGTKLTVCDCKVLTTLRVNFWNVKIRDQCFIVNPNE